MKSSPPQQGAMAEGWTADLLVFGQAVYHWTILPLNVDREWRDNFIAIVI